MVRLRSRLLFVADWLVVEAAEMIKAWIREFFRFFQQLVLAFSAVCSRVPVHVRVPTQCV